MIACDANATGASMEVDVFTLARHKGAKAAVSKHLPTERQEFMFQAR